MKTCRDRVAAVRREKSPVRSHRPSAGSAGSAVFHATASPAGKHVARRVRASPAHAPPHSDAAQGLEVSLRHILENLLLQRQLRHQSLELAFSLSSSFSRFA